MPAQDRLAKQVFELAQQVAQTANTPEAYELADMTANLYFGTQIGLAFLNRGAKGVRARQLLDDYESATAWMHNTKQAVRP